MEEIKVVTKEDKDILVLKEKTNEISERAIFKITSQEKLKQAVEGLTELKTFKNFIQEKKDKIIKPMTLALKNARDLFRPIEEKIDNTERSVKTEILSYKKVVDEAVEKQKEKIEKKVENGETNFGKGSEQIEKVENKTSGFKTRKIKKIVIVDRTKIPAEYWEINHTLIRTDALAGKNIPGIKVVEEEIAIM